MSNVEQVQKPTAEVAEAIVKEEKPEQDVKEEEEKIEQEIKEALLKVKGIVPEHLANAEVVCVLFADEEMRIPAGLMQQCKTFRDWFLDNCIDSKEKLANPDYVFKIPNASTEVMEILVEWMISHIGVAEPVVEKDPLTFERKRFDLTEAEKEFLDMPLDILGEILDACNFLDLKSLYLYGCQEMFDWMIKMAEDGRGEELREIIGTEPLTEEELEAVAKKNVWCTYCDGSNKKSSDS